MFDSMSLLSIKNWLSSDQFKEKNLKKSSKIVQVRIFLKFQLRLMALSSDLKNNKFSVGNLKML